MQNKIAKFSLGFTLCVLFSNSSFAEVFERFVTYTLNESQVAAIQSGGVDAFELSTGFSETFEPAQLQNVDMINVYVNFVDEQGNKLYVILRDLGGQYLHANGWQWFQAGLALNTGTVSGTYVNGWVFTDSEPAFPGNFACCTRTATSLSTIFSTGYGFNVTDSSIAVGGMRIQFNFNSYVNPVVISGGGGFDRMSLKIRSEGLVISQFPENTVSIDIKPGSDPNSINRTSGQKIPVAILYTDTFDATQVDWETVVFGPEGATEFHGRAHIKDVDEDGDMDLLLHFNSRDTGIACGDTEATLTGETFDGQAITGTDAINAANCP